ncbi:MAG: ABC transporter permease [Deltaproteobacteria bacterium]|nr:ABC transporter permease [Deltaproteobacteria bacterium]
MSTIRTVAISTTDVFRLLLQRRGGRAGLPGVVLLVLIATSADFLASDKPLLLSLGGHLYVLPNLFDPVALTAHSNQSLFRTMAAGDWLVAPLVPFGMNEQDKDELPLSPPSTRHLLGTDGARRDVLARLIHGSRISLAVGLLSVLITITLGTVLGLTAGFVGGPIDAVISRASETMIAVPALFLVLAVMGVVEQAGVGATILVIALVSWARVARLVRAETLRLREMEFVTAAVALGFSTRRILFHHILPNAMAPILVSATFGMASAILMEASLSFLGFGTPDSHASWGGLLHGAMGSFHAWWLVIFPGAAIFATVMAYNLTGDALRDILDPRLRHE